MKKSLLIAVAALLLAGSTAHAQNWKEALKQAASTAADKATDGKLTQYALVGTWNYAKPGVKMESKDAAAEMGSAMLTAAIASQLEKAYLKAGIKPGAGSFTFNKDNTFAATIGAQTFTGTYQFDHTNHTVSLHFAKGKVDLGAIPGHVYLSGTQLQLVFPVTKLVEIVKSVGAKIPELDSIMPLLEKADGLYIGFEMTRQ